MNTSGTAARSSEQAIDQQLDEHRKWAPYYAEQARREAEFRDNPEYQRMQAWFESNRQYGWSNLESNPLEGFFAPVAPGLFLRTVKSFSPNGLTEFLAYDERIDGPESIRYMDRKFTRAISAAAAYLTQAGVPVVVALSVIARICSLLELITEHQLKGSEKDRLQFPRYDDFTVAVIWEEALILAAAAESGYYNVISAALEIQRRQWEVPA
jgi:hypothetical protein